MGANDKVDAATTEEVRGMYSQSRSILMTEYRREQFDLWLAQVRAEAKAEALNEAAEALFDWNETLFMCIDECGKADCTDGMELQVGRDIQKWMRDRANQIRGS